MLLISYPAFPYVEWLLLRLLWFCTLSVFNGFQDMVASFFTAFDPQLKITVREGKVFDAQDERIRAVLCAS